MSTTELDRLEAQSVAAVDERKVRAAPLELLDQSEIVEMTLRPSLWYLLTVSGRFVGLMVIVGAVSLMASGGTELLPAVVGVTAIVAGVFRVLLAALQWASRVYILTNRRVMVIRGVWQLETHACRLSEIARVELEIDYVQRALRIGSLVILPYRRQNEALRWEDIAYASAVRDRLLRAIQKSRHEL